MRKVELFGVSEVPYRERTYDIKWGRRRDDYPAPDPSIIGPTYQGSPYDIPLARSCERLLIIDSIISPARPVSTGRILFSAPHGNLFRMRPPIYPVYKLPYRKPIRKPKLKPFSVAPFRISRGLQRLLISDPGLAARILAAKKEKYLEHVENQRKNFDNKRKRIHDVYLYKLRVRQQFVDRYNRVYDRRLQKYYRRLAIYRSIAERSLKPSRLRRRGTGVKFYDFHPYTRISLSGVQIPLVHVKRTSTKSAYPPIDYEYSLGITARVPTDVELEDITGLTSEDLRACFQPETDYLRSLANLRLGRYIRDRKFHLGMIIAERGETLRLLDELLRLAHDFVVVFKKKWLRDRVRDLVLHPSEVSDAVLAWQFGLKPILSDLKGIVDTISEDKKDLGHIVYRNRQSTYVDRNVIIGGLPFRCFGTLALRRTIHYSVNNPAFALFDRLGLSNPLSLLYEATPLSFVLDWFLPLSEYLDSLSASGFDLELRQVAAESLTFKGRLTSVLSSSPVDLTSGWVYPGEPPSGGAWPTTLPWYAQRVDQAVVVQPSDSSFEFKIRYSFNPTLAFDLKQLVKLPDCDVTRAVISAALSTQRLSRLFRS